MILNAGAALAVHAAEPGSFAERLGVGIERAQRSIASGHAQAALDRWVEAGARAAG